jgi:hypothetical protein
LHIILERNNRHGIREEMKAERMRNIPMLFDVIVRGEHHGIPIKRSLEGYLFFITVQLFLYRSFFEERESEVITIDSIRFRIYHSLHSLAFPCHHSKKIRVAFVLVHLSDGELMKESFYFIEFNGILNRLSEDLEFLWKSNMRNPHGIVQEVGMEHIADYLRNLHECFV